MRLQQRMWLNGRAFDLHAYVRFWISFQHNQKKTTVAGFEKSKIHKDIFVTYGCVNNSRMMTFNTGK